MNDFTARLREQFTDKDAVHTAVEKYFSLSGDTFTGSQFELLCDAAEPNTITADDLVAVTMLSVDIPARVSRWLLGAEGCSSVGALLQQIPTDVDIWDPQAADLLRKDGPAWTLWYLLRRASWPAMRSGNDMGPARTSKLLAAKRPRLIPIWDSVVRTTLGPVEDHWQDFREALLDEDLRSVIIELTASAPEHVSLLRRIDAVVWYLNRHLRDGRADADE